MWLAVIVVCATTPDNKTKCVSQMLQKFWQDEQVCTRAVAASRIGALTQSSLEGYSIFWAGGECFKVNAKGT